MKKKKITLLLGAGASQIYEYDSTAQITQKVVSALRNQASESVFVPIDGLPEEDTQRVRSAKGGVSKVLAELISTIDKDNTMNASGPVTYEQIYYIVHELSLMRTGQYENPWLRELMRRVAKDLNLSMTPFEGQGLSDLIWCGDSIKKVIEFVVSGSLCRKATEPQLKMKTVVSDLFDSVDEYDLSVFTLNHDRLVEQLLDNRKVDYEDGFHLSSSGDYVWDPSLLENSDGRPRVVHLHGSIYWFVQKSQRVKFFPDVNIYRGDPSEFLEFVKTRNPMFLTGTTNKFTEYTQGIFWEVLTNFDRVLKRSQLIIVMGYSFRDRGINSLLYRWMDSRPSGKMIVLAKSPKDIEYRIRDFDFETFDAGLTQTKCFEIVKADLRECRWDDLKQYLVSE